MYPACLVNVPHDRSTSAFHPPGHAFLLLSQAKYILLATGGKAVKLPIEGAEHAIISDEILNLPSLPKKLAVIGGGYIGLEFAGIYNNYGSEVHVVYRQVSLC